MLERWASTCCRAVGQSPGRHLLGTTRRAQGACSLGERRPAGPGRTPAGPRRALSGGPWVPDRWKGADSDSAGAVSPTATLWSQDRVSRRGRSGRQSKEDQWASQRAAYPDSGTERPDPSGRRGVLTCRGPVIRDSGSPSGRTRIAARSPPRAWGAGQPQAAGIAGMEAATAPGGTRPSLHDSASSEQVPPGPCTDRFIAHRPGGPGHPCFPCNICTRLHPDPGFKPAARLISCLCCTL
jgi:hypothetical protein